MSEPTTERAKSTADRLKVLENSVDQLARSLTEDGEMLSDISASNEEIRTRVEALTRELFKVLEGVQQAEVVVNDTYFEPGLIDRAGTEFYTALVEAKKVFGPVIKNMQADEGSRGKRKYADLQSVFDATTPGLLEHGLLLVQQIYVNQYGVSLLLTRLIHVTGQYLASYAVINPTAGNIQGYGSALTYMRRYNALMILGVAPEDDDGKDAVAADQGAQPGRGQGRQSGRRDWIAEINALSSDELTEVKIREMGRLAASRQEFPDRGPVADKFREALARAQQLDAQRAESKATQQAAEDARRADLQAEGSQAVPDPGQDVPAAGTETPA